MPRIEYDESTDAYVALQVDPGAHPDVVAAAHRALVKLLHPDRAGGDGRRMAEVNAAFDVLSDPDCRRAYDSERVEFNRTLRAVLAEQFQRNDAGRSYAQTPRSPRHEPPHRRASSHETAMPFGRYKHWAVTDLPDDYLRWLAEDAQIASDSLRAAILREFDQRGL